MAASSPPPPPSAVPAAPTPPGREELIASFFVPPDHPGQTIEPDQVMLRLTVASTTRWESFIGFVIGMLFAAAWIGKNLFREEEGLVGHWLTWIFTLGLAVVGVMGIVFALRRKLRGPVKAVWEGLGDGRCRITGLLWRRREFRPAELAHLWPESKTVNNNRTDLVLMARTTAGRKIKLCQLQTATYLFDDDALNRIVVFLQAMNPTLTVGADPSKQG